jgi:hypothetical protein
VNVVAGRQWLPGSLIDSKLRMQPAQTSSRRRYWLRRQWGGKAHFPSCGFFSGKRKSASDFPEGKKQRQCGKSHNDQCIRREHVRLSISV